MQMQRTHFMKFSLIFNVIIETTQNEQSEKMLFSLFAFCFLFSFSVSLLLWSPDDGRQSPNGDKACLHIQWANTILYNLRNESFKHSGKSFVFNRILENTSLVATIFLIRSCWSSQPWSRWRWKKRSLFFTLFAYLHLGAMESPTSDELDVNEEKKMRNEKKSITNNGNYSDW